MKTILILIIVFIVVSTLLAIAQEPSPIPTPPPLGMKEVQSVLAEKDTMMNSKLLELAQANSTIEQLQKVIVEKDAALKKATVEKKCQ